MKAVAADPKLRFETAEEMLLALEVGGRKPLLPPRRTPLAGRDPPLLWQWVALLSLLGNIMLLYVIVVS